MSKTVKKYSYSFGIDSFLFGRAKLHNDMCFISEDIEIENLKENEYIQLISNYNTGGNGSIEFYILDGANEKPILPIDTNTIIDEKIFFGLRTRFSVDTDKEILVKKNGMLVDISLDQAINSNEDGYTVSYTPLDAHNVNIKNNIIQIKAIIRTYDNTQEAPFIKSIAVKKYGGVLIYDR